MSVEDLTKTGGALGSTQSTNQSLKEMPKALYATLGAKKGLDEYECVNLKKTCMTGIRSAGFFTQS